MTKTENVLNEESRKESEMLSVSKKWTCVLILIASAFLGNNLFSQELNYKPGEVLIKFNPGSVVLPQGKLEGLAGEVMFESALVDSILNIHNFSKIEKLYKNFDPNNLIQVNPAGDTAILMDLSNNFKITFPETTDILPIIQKLFTLKEVIYAEPNYIYQLFLEPNDPLFFEQWHLKNTGQNGGAPGEDIRAVGAWDKTTGSPDVKIGILDSGIDFYNIDLGDGPIPNEKVIWGYNYYDGNEDAMDYYYHGTAVAGLASAITNNDALVAGVSWGSSLLSMKIGPGPGVSGDAAAPAINECINQGVRVINNSWGGTGYSNTLAEVMRNAFLSGVSPIIVCAMGNWSGNTMKYPAGYYGTAYAVGAWLQSGGRWDGSNWGWWIDISAPGGANIVTTDLVSYGSSNYNFGGTSAAAPIVSGVAALLLSYEPTLTNDDVQEIMNRTAREAGSPGKDDYYGWGKVNADSALWFISFPRVLVQRSTADVYQYGEPTNWNIWLINVPGLFPQTYITRKYEIRADVSFPPFDPSVTPEAWVRAVGTNGWGFANPFDYLVEGPWGEVVPGTLTPSGCTFRTYVYDVYDFGGDPCGWYPCQPDQVTFAYTLVSHLALHAPQVGVSLIQNASDHYFHIAWSDDNEFHDGYELQYATATPYGWTTFATVSADWHTYNYVPVWGSAMYYFRVRALLGAVGSGWSNEEGILNVPNSPTDPHVTLHHVCGWPGQLKVAAEYRPDSYFPPHSLLVFPDLPENPSGTLCDLAPEPGPDPPPCFPSNRAYVSWSPPENQAAPVDYYNIRLLLYLGGMPAVYWVGPLSAEACTLCLWPNKEYRLNVVAYRDGLHSDEVVNPQIFTTGEAIVCNDYSHKGTPPEDSASEEPGIESDLVSDQSSLAQNRPNPFNPETDISYDLPENCMANLIIYNMLGQKVRVLVDEQQMAGFKTVRWDGKDEIGNQVASGVYFYRLQAGESVEVRRMILLR